MSTGVHENFCTFEASNNFDLGVSMGKIFGEGTRATIAKNRQALDWTTKTERAKQYLAVTEKHFPQYIEEIQGYAEGAEADFLDVWTLSLEDEVDQAPSDKCTTIITNNGKLIAHNEDWSEDAADRICVLQKKIGTWMSIFELHYFNTLGGNSMSINSHGFITSVNTLLHEKKGLGIPRNVIARWFSETQNPEEDFRKLENLPRSLGFNFNILHTDGTIWDIEYNAAGAVLAKPSTPYVHTNHCISELRSYETRHPTTSSFDRYDVAHARVTRSMTTAELQEITNDTSRGSVVSIMNERTIAKIVIDVHDFIAKVWLKREKNKGWIAYDLQGVLGDR